MISTQTKQDAITREWEALTKIIALPKTKRNGDYNMAWYTSRYSNRELDDNKYYTVGISLGRPKFPIRYNIDSQIYAFAPNRDMWGKDRETFKRLYLKKISDLGNAKIKNFLNQIEANSNGKDIVFLCFEDIRDESQHCHRTSFAEYLNENFGLDVKELKDDSEVRFKKKPEKAKKDEWEQLSFL